MMMMMTMMKSAAAREPGMYDGH